MAIESSTPSKTAQYGEKICLGALGNRITIHHALFHRISQRQKSSIVRAHLEEIDTMSHQQSALVNPSDGSGTARVALATPPQEPQHQHHSRRQIADEQAVTMKPDQTEGVAATKQAPRLMANKKLTKVTNSTAVPLSPDADLDFHYVSTPSIDSDSSVVDDADSAVGRFSTPSSTMSLTASIYEHVEENGRTYHSYKEGIVLTKMHKEYMLPNDESERERLDLQHALFGLTFGKKLYLAPIGKNPHRVLDIATGTGIWAIDFATLHPSAEVIGTDLSAIQPDYIPPNCKFEIDDAEDEWTFSKPFDYIHGRALGTCFTDPSAVFAEAFNALAPGGYFEMQDAIMPMKYVGNIPDSSSLYKWNQHVVEASNRAKRPWTNVQHYPRYYSDAGFVDVQELMYYWPTNAWAKGDYFKTLSVYFQQDLLDGLEGLSLKLFTNFLGWSRETVQDFLVGVREDLQDRSIHAYVEISVVYGRKPPLPTGEAGPA